tara:strand:- start:9852 stop:10523 length:672 start_codon:yes stop_codon:yes gene_type:complete
MERLSLSSFVHHEHPVDLYTYEEISNVPDGVTIRDGNEILPESMIFQYKDHKSFSAFSNYFRYKLLYEKGNWWVDTDVVCLRPFDFVGMNVFCSEDIPPFGTGNHHIGSCVIKLPKGSPLAKEMFEYCMKQDKETLKWGTVGPKLVQNTINKYNMGFFVEKPQVFCPVPGSDWWRYISKDSLDLPEQTYTAHLWNEMWRREAVDKNAKFHENSFYEKLKKRHL